MKPERNKSYRAKKDAHLWIDSAVISVDENKVVIVKDDLEVWIGPVEYYIDVIAMYGFEALDKGVNA